MGAKIEKNGFLGGHVISTLAKHTEMLQGVQLDLRAKFGALSSLQLTLRKFSKKFSFWGPDL